MRMARRQRCISEEQYPLFKQVSPTKLRAYFAYKKFGNRLVVYVKLTKVAPANDISDTERTSYLQRMRRWAFDITFYLERHGISRKPDLLVHGEGMFVFNDHGVGMEFAKGFPTHLGTTETYRNGFLIGQTFNEPVAVAITATNEFEVEAEEEGELVVGTAGHVT